jgi:hypothetical protein
MHPLGPLSATSVALAVLFCGIGLAPSLMAQGQETLNAGSCVSPKPVGRLTHPALNECSGIVKSRRHPEVFWVHNDSGNASVLYPIRVTGEVLGAPGTPEGKRGVEVRGGSCVDWEDIALNDNGEIYILDAGNNKNTRRDLAILVVDEPDPAEATFVTVKRVLPFYFPEQTEYPPKELLYDCEALYLLKGVPYVVTKRQDKKAALYRIETRTDGKPAPARLLGLFDTGGKVTAADVSPDGARVALLTKKAIWLFSVPPKSENIFEGTSRSIPIKAGQAESLTFATNSELIITNEERNVLTVTP